MVSNEANVKVGWLTLCPLQCQLYLLECLCQVILYL